MSIDFSSIYRFRDLIDLSVCLHIYNACNGNQFDCCTGSDFVNFLNLKETTQPIKVKERKGLQLMYLIHKLLDFIPTEEMKVIWRDEMLKKCGITYDYYDSHKGDFDREDDELTKRNKDYRNAILKALKRARKCFDDD